MKRILLIEDERSLRRACEIGLRAKGHVVVTAMGGDEGVRLARSDRFDLILIDKLAGLDVLRRLKAHPDTASIPVMIVRADASLDALPDRLADFFAAAR